MKAVSEIERLIDAALAIHVRQARHNHYGYAHSCVACRTAWPCKTVRALNPHAVYSECEGCAEAFAKEQARLAQPRVDYPGLYLHEGKNAASAILEEVTE